MACDKWRHCFAFCSASKDFLWSGWFYSRTIEAHGTQARGEQPDWVNPKDTTNSHKRGTNYLWPCWNSLSCTPKVFSGTNLCCCCRRGKIQRLSAVVPWVEIIENGWRTSRSFVGMLMWMDFNNKTKKKKKQERESCFCNYALISLIFNYLCRLLDFLHSAKLTCRVSHFLLHTK